MMGDVILAKWTFALNVNISKEVWILYAKNVLKIIILIVMENVLSVII
jgi:hypothetical protein